MLLQRIRSLQLLKQKKIQLLVLAFLLLFGFFLIKMLQPDRVYQYEGNYFFAAGETAENTVIYEDIALPPGVYYVELSFDADTDGIVGFCTIQDGTVIRGGLLTNGEHLYAGNDRTGYHIWLFEGTERLQVLVSHEGSGQLATGNLTITETNYLWMMLLVILFFAAALLAGVILFCAYEKQYGVPARGKQVFFFVTLIGLLASLPCMYGSLLGGADLTYHLQRIEGCKDGILSGQFPVRIEPEWLYGHGYANAVFYCNALLYLPALFRLAGFTVTTSYNIYCVFLNLATAWIAWYCFGRIFRNDAIGLMCSGLYTLSVFRIYKLFFYGAVGEGSAYTFLPLVLYGLYRVFTEDPEERRYKMIWLPLAVGYAGLIQTHVLTCEITAFVTIVICLVFARRIFCRRTFWELFKGAAGALGLSLWYLVPFLDYYVTQDVHIKHVSARTIQDRGLSAAQLLTGWQGENFSEFNIGFVLLPGLCVLGGLWLRGRLRGREEKLVKFAMLSEVLSVMLLTMSLDIFPWDAIQNRNALCASLVSSLQFPNRFLGWGTAFLVMVSGFVLWYLQDKNRAVLFRIGLGAAAAGIVMTGIYQMNRGMKERDTLQLYNEEGMGFGYISGAEYLIQGADDRLLTFRGAQPAEDVRIDDYQKKYLHVEMECTKEGLGESYVDLPLLLYKGYRACEKSTGENLEICYGDNYVLRVMLPEGFSGGGKGKLYKSFLLEGGGSG